MKSIPRQSFRELVEHSQAPSVSIYSPMVVAGSEVQQNPIRFKNLLNEAKKVLTEEQQQMLAPAEKLLEDPMFWQHQGPGLAVFLAKDFFKYYQLPMDVKPLVQVSRHFHISPLVRVFNEDGQFYVLSLSMGGAHLYRASHFDLEEMELGAAVPKSLDEALEGLQKEKALNYHSQNTGGGAEAVYHGHDDPNAHRQDLLRWFRPLAQEVRRLLNEQGGGPLVLAGVEYLHPIFREAIDYSGLTDTAVMGSIEEMSEKELLEKAWPCVEEVIKSREMATLERLNNLSGSGKTSEQLEEVVKESLQGRVDTLFLSQEHQVWGQWQEESEPNNFSFETANPPAAEELMNLAAIHTIRKGGKVHVVAPEQMPRGAGMAALFRY